MKNIRGLDVKDKKILLRVDFDVPVSDRGEIEEPFRIKKQKEVIDYLHDAGARIVMVAHISAVKSFSELIPQLHILLGKEIGLIKSIGDIEEPLNNYSAPLLLDNIRQNEGEENNDSEFARELAKHFDIYINNAFAVCHRNHASVSAVTEFLPSYAGFLIEEETQQLAKAMADSDGKLIIMGGAKASTKVPVIKNLIDKSDAILLGGVVANDVLKEKGQDMGSSVVDENSAELLKGLNLNDSKLITPKDFVVFDNKILDIGEDTINEYKERIARAKMIIWNGPMGLFENPTFAKGTNDIAIAISESSAYKVIGGGDTISALNKINILNKFDFVSTGGGAMLSFLAGDEMPALKALGYYE